MGIADRLPPDKFEEVARMVLDVPTYEYIRSGADEEITLAENVSAFRCWRLLTRVLVGDVSRIELSMTATGTALDFPVMVAPMAVHKIASEEGELDTAKAVAEVGSGLIISANASVSIEEVRRSQPKLNLWLQLYNWRDRDALGRLIVRGEESGVTGIVATVNTPIPVIHGSGHGGFRLPTSVTYAHFDQSQALDSALDWAYIDWLKTRTTLPIIVKGITGASDAKRAIDAGAAALIVSNHGGRQLDRAIASIEALPAVVDAVAYRTDVYMDGGVRRGADVFVALALGAKAVMVGRPVMWGLAVSGSAGVATVLRTLRDELRHVMALAGVRSVRDIAPSMVHRID